MNARKFPELVTPRMFREETGLPASLVRAIFARCPRYPTPTRSIVVRRSDLELVLRNDAPKTYPGGNTWA